MNREWWSQFAGKTLTDADEHYKLNKLLGFGSFGGVFHAEALSSGQSAAVKLISPPEGDRDALWIELLRGLKLRHKGLVQCLDAGQANLGGVRFLYLAMELAEGTLVTKLERGVMSSEEVRQLASQVAETLRFLHKEKRLVHRDLKPANLLWVGGQWKLADLGIMRSVQATMEKTSRQLGTLPYMPPESFRDEVSSAWDIWSLGVMLAEALTGSRPFGVTSDAVLIAAILMRDPELPPDLPEDWTRIFRGCLEKDRSIRWTADQLLQSTSVQPEPLSPVVPAPIPIDQVDLTVKYGTHLLSQGEAVREAKQQYEKKEYSAAFPLLERVAHFGDSRAIFYLGRSYDFGQGVQQDYAQAKQWYEKAANLDHALAMRNLGVLYHNGQGVQQDYAQAKQWYEKAASLGYALAMYNLGVLYDNGRGVQQDYAQAKQWYEKAASLGHAGTVGSFSRIKKLLGFTAE